MDLYNKTPQHVSPDEWGFFDPDQAGLAAVLERLDAVSTSAPPADDAIRMAASMRDAELRSKSA